MLTGLISNALEWRRQMRAEHERLQERLVFASARAPEVGDRAMTDYQTVELKQTDEAWQTCGTPGRRTSEKQTFAGSHQRYRVYHADIGGNSRRGAGTGRRGAEHRDGPCRTEGTGAAAVPRTELLPSVAASAGGKGESERCRRSAVPGGHRRKAAVDSDDARRRVAGRRRPATRLARHAELAGLDSRRYAPAGRRTNRGSEQTTGGNRMYMMQAPIDMRRLRRWAANRGLRYEEGSDNGYILHVLLCGMFGPKTIQPVRLFSSRRRPQASLYGCSDEVQRALAGKAGDFGSPDSLDVIEPDAIRSPPWLAPGGPSSPERSGHFGGVRRSRGVLAGPLGGQLPVVAHGPPDGGAALPGNGRALVLGARRSRAARARSGARVLPAAVGAPRPARGGSRRAGRRPGMAGAEPSGAHGGRACGGPARAVAVRRGRPPGCCWPSAASRSGHSSVRYSGAATAAPPSRHALRANLGHNRPPCTEPL